jgi:DNA gyrase inhibitor GyrI
MDTLDVRIVKLEPFRAICFNGFGESPEGQALEKLQAWAKAKNLLNDGTPRRFFGYNNPNPAPGSPNYGYDVWMTVDETIQAEAGARIIDFPGGLYAVTRCKVESPGDDIPATWHQLVQWMEHSQYRHGPHQWLEEHIDPQNASSGSNFTLDLFLPIVE